MDDGEILAGLQARDPAGLAAAYGLSCSSMTLRSVGAALAASALILREALDMRGT